MGTCTGMLLLYSLLSVSCFYCATSFAWIEQRDGGSSELLRLHSNEFSQAEKNLTELLQLLQPEELDRIASVQYSLGELYGRAIKVSCLLHSKPCIHLYLMQPGHALEAEHWLLQCTTTDLTKLDCWMSLAALYFKTNQFGKLKAVHLEIMKSPPGSPMDTQRDYQWRCLAPALLVSQMSALYYSAQGGHVGQAEWTYLALLVARCELASNVV